MSQNASKTFPSDLDGVGQLKMFHETAADAVRELGRQYIAAAGKEHGLKAFAKRLFPHKSDDQAYTRLMNCTNPNTKDVFDDDEWRAIIQIGHEQDKHFVAQFFVGLAYELTPIRAEDITKRARKAERRALLSRLAALDEDE